MLWTAWGNTSGRRTRRTTIHDLRRARRRKAREHRRVGGRLAGPRPRRRVVSFVARARRRPRRCGGAPAADNAACARRRPRRAPSAREHLEWLKNTGGGSRRRRSRRRRRRRRRSSVPEAASWGAPRRSRADVKRDRSMDARRGGDLRRPEARVDARQGGRALRRGAWMSAGHAAGDAATRRRCSGGTPARRAGRTRSLPCTRGGATT